MSIHIEYEDFSNLLNSFKEKYLNRMSIDLNYGNNLFNYDIFNDDYDSSTIELFKHEKKTLITGKIDADSDYIFIDRKNVSKFEILRKQYKFYEIFEKYLKNFSDFIKAKEENEGKNKKLFFEDKNSFEKFNKEFSKELFEERLFMKV